MTFSKRLKKARKDATLTQGQLAERSGISQATISKIERGEQYSSTVTVELADALGISARYLATGFEDGVNENPGDYHRTFNFIPMVSGPDELLTWEADMKKNPVIQIQVVDDSMSTTDINSFHFGTIVTIDTKKTVKNNDFVLARVRGNYTFKQLKSDGVDQFLISLDPRFPSIKIDTNCKILGKAVKAERSWIL